MHCQDLLDVLHDGVQGVASEIEDLNAIGRRGVRPCAWSVARVAETAREAFLGQYVYWRIFRAKYREKRASVR